MKKIIGPGLLSGLAILIVSMAVSKIFGFIIPGLNAEYQTPGLFRPWADPIMSLYFVYPFILGLLLAWFWNKTKSVFGSDIKGGINFGVAYWIIASIPGMFISYSSFPVSLMLIISWSIGGLICAILAGIILAKVNK